MKGSGIIKGLGVTLKHFFMTYWEDLMWSTKKNSAAENLQRRTSADARGIFTIQYPEEKMALPEEFRFIPFLVYDEMPGGVKADRCTSCGIVRTNDPKTGRPVPAPAEFSIDVDVCMNCGLCAEYCPFDAIKMDHDYEIASYDRFAHHIFNKEKLSKPASYYASIRPMNFAREQAAKAEKEAKKAAA